MSSEGFNEKVESLCSRYEALKNELEIFEQERGSILDDVHNRYYNTGDELKNKELRELYETFKVALEGLKLSVPAQNLPKEKETKQTKKCRYHNRGYCKFGEKCHFFHSRDICEEFRSNGLCRQKNCFLRHPKNCRYWTRTEEGCKRNEECVYLHDITNKISV